jgi:hypothetical protein
VEAKEVQVVSVELQEEVRQTPEAMQFGFLRQIILLVVVAELEMLPEHQHLAALQSHPPEPEMGLP